MLEGNLAVLNHGETMAKPRKRKTAPLRKEGLSEAASDSRINGSELLSDAEHLLNSERYARALALAVLAEEEFAKAFILDNADMQQRWDPLLFGALVDHQTKLGLADGLREMVAHIQLRAGAFPNDAELERISAQVDQLMKSHPRHDLKMKSLYVQIGPNGKSLSQPRNITRDQAETCIVFAKNMRDLVMTQLMEFPAVRPRN